MAGELVFLSWADGGWWVCTPGHINYRHCPSIVHSRGEGWVVGVNNLTFTLYLCKILLLHIWGMNPGVGWDGWGAPPVVVGMWV